MAGRRIVVDHRPGVADIRHRDDGRAAFANDLRHEFQKPGFSRKADTGSRRQNPEQPAEPACEHCGDRIAVYPVFEAFDIGSTARLRPVPLRDPRFVIDVNLGRLARLLRVLGFDVWWSSDADDQTLADVSLGQQRILLTRDRALLKRRAITRGLFVHSDHAEEQTLEVIRRLDLRHRLAPFTRCVPCNGRLVAVTKDEVIDHLEPLTRRYYNDFSRCAECGRIYWPGSHRARLVSVVEGLRNQL